jgi:hypothetical protein
MAVLVTVPAHADVAPLPPDFGIQARHETVHAIYSKSQGESPNMVDRRQIEANCAIRRQFGSTSLTPIFEAGFDRPNRTEWVRVVAPTAWANYETMQGYACDPASMGPKHDDCGCTYREMTSRFVHIRKSVDGVTDVIDAEVTRGTGTRRTRRETWPMPGTGPDVAVFGPVVGHDVVAGMPCSIRRQDLGTGRTERCLADRVPSVPRQQQDQLLAQTMYHLDHGQPIKRDWWRTEVILPEADVDAGIFDAPRGIAFKNLDAAPGGRP